MQSDTKIICRRDRYAILSQVQELPLRDGSTTKLHLVQLQGEAGPSRFLRAIANDVAGTFIFDVTALDKELDLDIRQLPARDTMGVISLTLRQKFLTGATLRMAIIENCLVSFRDGLGKSRRPARPPVNFHSTSGHADFLSDDAGDRRFWPIPSSEAVDAAAR